MLYQQGCFPWNKQAAAESDIAWQGLVVERSMHVLWGNDLEAEGLDQQNTSFHALFSFSFRKNIASKTKERVVK